MIFHRTKIKDLFVLEPELKEDSRGYFARIYSKDELKKNGLNFEVVQINRSLNLKMGTIRGMHLQKEPRAEDKIVQCIKGEIFDVAIDLRPDSKTYGKWVSQELSENNKKMFYIPKGFAHGFQTLTNNCEILYFMSEYYSPEHANGFGWNDPFFKIEWPLANPTLSDRDKIWPFIKKKYEK